jgi:small subunit ribosomal protein S2
VAVVKMKDLLEAGVHFGHRTRRWHPRMKPYLFTERNGIHIIDLQQTMGQIEAAYQRTRTVVASGGSVLFVGTKKQAQQSIQETADAASMPYVNHRWLGGTLTNFRTIRQRVDYMIKLEQQRERGDFDRLTKKEALEKERLIAKLETRLGGLRELRRLPDLVFITDVCREDIAVQECNKLNIPIIAMVDTNCDPDPIDLVIPANDDAIRAIKLIAGVIAQAASEGQMMREIVAAEEEEDYRGGRSEEVKEPENFLGPSTLAKLARGFDDDEETIGDFRAVAVEDDEITGLDLSDFVVEEEEVIEA